MPAKSLEIRFKDDKARSTLQVLVPAGMSHKELSKITLGDLLSKFRPSGCPQCFSGQHFDIREKFERVLPVEINAGKISF